MPEPLNKGFRGREESCNLTLFKKPPMPFNEDNRLEEMTQIRPKFKSSDPPKAGHANKYL